MPGVVSSASHLWSHFTLGIYLELSSPVQHWSLAVLRVPASKADLDLISWLYDPRASNSSLKWE